MTDWEHDEATRLERLWAGEFGAAYADRNPVVVDLRAGFWDGLLERHPIRSVLEVGANLAPLARRLDPAEVGGSMSAPSRSVGRGSTLRAPMSC